MSMDLVGVLEDISINVGRCEADFILEKLIRSGLSYNSIVSSLDFISREIRGSFEAKKIHAINTISGEHDVVLIRCIKSNPSQGVFKGERYKCIAKTGKYGVGDVLVVGTAKNKVSLIETDMFSKEGVFSLPVMGRYEVYSILDRYTELSRC